MQWSSVVTLNCSVSFIPSLIQQNSSSCGFCGAIPTSWCHLWKTQDSHLLQLQGGTSSHHLELPKFVEVCKNEGQSRDKAQNERKNPWIQPYFPVMWANWFPFEIFLFFCSFFFFTLSTLWFVFVTSIKSAEKYYCPSPALTPFPTYLLQYAKLSIPT